jgi:PAS domain S-box-containing protein
MVDTPDSSVVLDALGHGVIVVDHGGTCIYANPAAATLLGYAPHDLHGRDFTSLVHSPSAPADGPLVEVLRTSRLVVAREDVLLRSDGVPVRVSYVAKSLPGQRVAVLSFTAPSAPAADATAAVFTAVLRSFTARPDFESFMSRVVPAMLTQTVRPDAAQIYVYNEGAHTLRAHRALIFGEHTAFEGGPIVGDEPIGPEVDVADVPLWQRLVREHTVLAIELGSQLEMLDPWPEIMAWHRLHEHTHAIYSALLLGERPFGMLCLAYRRTTPIAPHEIVAAESLIRPYMTTLFTLALLGVQERRSAVLAERARLAREIHDTLAQGFAGVIVQLQAATDQHTTSAEDRSRHLAHALQLANTSLAEARRSMQALRPSALVNTDIGSALTQLAQQLTAQSAVEITCTVMGSRYALPGEVEVQLLAISREALLNTLKHSQARRVHLSLVFEPTQLRLRIEDDGVGFDPDLTFPGAFGLLGMQERARLIDATLTIFSTPGWGTTIVGTVPTIAARHERVGP